MLGHGLKDMFVETCDLQMVGGWCLREEYWVFWKLVASIEYEGSGRKKRRWTRDSCDVYSFAQCGKTAEVLHNDF
jgi:hypothetical protein